MSFNPANMDKYIEDVKKVLVDAIRAPLLEKKIDPERYAKVFDLLAIKFKPLVYLFAHFVTARPQVEKYFTDLGNVVFAHRQLELSMELYIENMIGLKSLFKKSDPMFGRKLEIIKSYDGQGKPMPGTLELIQRLNIIRNKIIHRAEYHRLELESEDLLFLKSRIKILNPKVEETIKRPLSVSDIYSMACFWAGLELSISMIAIDSIDSSEFATGILSKYGIIKETIET